MVAVVEVRTALYESCMLAVRRRWIEVKDGMGERGRG